jgi:tetratricopeptide (TPR) repeat protein
MELDNWHLLGMLAALAGTGLAVRQMLRAWSLRALQRLADECLALERWWHAIDRLPAELQSQSLRLTLGRLMVQRLRRAQHIRPDHPLLREQSLRIARFIGRTPPQDGRRVTGPAREQAMATLADIRELLAECGRDRLVAVEEVERCERRVTDALAELEFQHYRQAALQAEYLQRIPQAIDCLKSALRCIDHLAPEAPQRRDAAHRLALLETRMARGDAAGSATLNPFVG